MLINMRKDCTIGLGLLFLMSGPQGCGPEESLSPASPIGSLAQAEGLGKDGDVMISAAGTIVNRYAVLGADARLGDTTIKLSAIPKMDVSSLLPLVPDDLLLIVQTQGADIDTTNTTSLKQ